MKKISMYRNNYINLVCVFLIVVVFLIMSFILIFIGLGFYEDTNKELDRSFNSNALISYINNKINSFDGESICIIANKYDKDAKVLVLENTKMKVSTYIYSMEGYVYEDTVVGNSEFKYSKGQQLFKIDKLNICSESSHLIKISVAANEEEIDSYVYVNKGLKI